MLLDRAALARLTLELPADAQPCLRFAAEELRRYLLALAPLGDGRGDDRLPLHASPALRRGRLRLGDGPAIEAAPAADAFRVAAAERGLTLAGGSDRAVLYAVYRVLEELGCVWSFHGAGEETVPALPAAGARLVDLADEPPWQVRAYATDIHTHHYREPELMARRMPSDVAFIDWMGKTGANAFLFIRHPFDTQLTLPELLPEFAKRGIAPEYGGHVLPLLLPRERFASHPEWFPADAHGRRTDLGNMCTSSAAALSLVAEAAAAYARRHPEMRTLHIWGADLWDGGWCHCAGCAGTTVQDQSLRVCNAVAETLARTGLSLAVCYLAYHDTIDPELTLRPHADVVAEFAPRERCYGHALDDPACSVNPRYRVAFEKHVERFDGRVRVFEYYGDAILFCGIAAPLTEVIAADLEYYHRAGARQISFLQFGAYSLWAHPRNFEVFAERVARRAPRRVGDGPPYSAYPASFWADLEDAIAGVVTYGDVRRPPRKCAEQIRPRLEASLARLRAWIPRLQGDPMAQRPLLEYTVAVIEGVLLQLAGTATAIDEAEACYRRALDVLDAVEDRHVGIWGRRNLPVIHSFHSATSRRS